MARSDNDGISALLTDRAFLFGLAAIAGGLVVFALLFNYAVMPIWTRHEATVSVPDVREMDPGDAEGTLRLAGLEGVYDEQPYNPNISPDIVVDQSPAAGETVKPGRRIYYYVNAQPKDLVAVPQVATMAEGKAREEIGDAELVVGRVDTDTVRTPYENTVTRQQPESGRQVPVGTRVMLWLSPGVDNTREVRVPDVVGLPVGDARQRIRGAELWVDSPRAESGEVTGQDPDRGEMLHPGEEVRIYTEGSGPGD